MPNKAHSAPETRRGTRLVSVRTSLLVSFGAVLLVIGLGLAYNNFRVGDRIQRWVATSLLEKTADLTEAKVESFLQPAENLCSVLALMAESRLIDDAQPASIVRMAAPLLANLEAVSSLNLGGSDGWGLLILADGDGWRTREVQAETNPGEVEWTRWSATGQKLTNWTATLSYDPRLRPWYQAALKYQPVAGTNTEPALPEVVWTGPYAFQTTQAPGMTASVAVSARRAERAVVACDVLLQSLDQFARTHPPTPNGYTIIVNDNAEVLGAPRRKATGDTPPPRRRTQKVTEAPQPELAAVADAWVAADRPADFIRKIRVDGEHYWFSARPIQVSGARFWALMIVPQGDLIGELTRERQILIGVLAGALLLALVLALILAGTYSAPLRELVHRSERIERLDLTLPRRSHPTSKLREVNRLFQAQARMRSALESFSRYVPVEVIRELLDRGEAAQIGAQPAELTVMFSDIRGFTTISETMSPDALAGLLSEYFDALQHLIETGRGTTDKFIGDAILAFWGAPKPDPHHARHAVESVLACVRELAALNRSWDAAGKPRLETCFGLATGPVVVGNVGAHSRMNYTVLGNTVNVASRLEHLCRELGCEILATETVKDAAGENIVWRRVGPVAVRGKRERLEVFEPLGTREDVDDQAVEFGRAYETALQHFLKGDFTLTLAGLTPWRGPIHPAAEALAARCELYQRGTLTGPPFLVAGNPVPTSDSAHLRKAGGADES
jgi:adenylate cyclase